MVGSPVDPDVTAFPEFLGAVGHFATLKDPSCVARRMRAVLTQSKSSPGWGPSVLAPCFRHEKKSGSQKLMAEHPRPYGWWHWLRNLEAWQNFLVAIKRIAASRQGAHGNVDLLLEHNTIHRLRERHLVCSHVSWIFFVARLAFARLPAVID